MSIFLLCRNCATTAMLFFSPIITRTGPLRIADCRATAAGPFCLRLGGKDGCQSVVFWVSVEMRPSTNDSLFLSLLVALYLA